MGSLPEPLYPVLLYQQYLPVQALPLELDLPQELNPLPVQALLSAQVPLRELLLRHPLNLYPEYQLKYLPLLPVLYRQIPAGLLRWSLQWHCSARHSWWLPPVPHGCLFSVNSLQLQARKSRIPQLKRTLQSVLSSSSSFLPPEYS
jgi:hypothetical protein